MKTTKHKQHNLPESCFEKDFINVEALHKIKQRRQITGGNTVYRIEVSTKSRESPCYCKQ